MPLPITAGFILPDGTLIDSSGGIGHNKAAMRYINANKTLLKHLKEYNRSDEDFLMYRLGAMKVCAYNGIRYIYVPYVHNEFQSQMKILYASYGFKVIPISSNFGIGVSEESMRECNVKKVYTPQIIRIKDPNGTEIYSYNPQRIGD